MNIISAWKREEERKNRHALHRNQWENVVLCLGSEGYSVKYIQEVLTLGRGADQGIRDLWGLGVGKAPKWTADQEKQAYNITWNFFKRDIETLYYGQTDSDGKVIVKGQSTVNVQRIIHENTGFKLPSQSMQNQMLRVWGFSMRSRPNKAKSEDPFTPDIKVEDSNAPFLSEGQDYQDLQDHKIKREIRSESCKLSCRQSKTGQVQGTSDDLRFRRLECQIKILTEDFKAALEIGHNQGTALNKVEEQLQKLNSEVAHLRSENSVLATQNEDLRKKNDILEHRVDELLGFNENLEANINDLRTKTIELQEEVNSLDALKLENQNLRTQNAILLKEHELLKHTLCKLVAKIQQLPSAPGHILKNEVEKLAKMCDSHKLPNTSPRESVDSAYYSTSSELEIRQSLNMIPIRFQTVTSNRAREMGICHKLDANQRRHCNIIQTDVPMAMSDAESPHEREIVAAKPHLTRSEFGDQPSRQEWRNDPVVETQMAEVEDTPMQDCVLPAGPPFTVADAGFGEQWNDPIMFDPPQQIPNFNPYSQADGELEDCH